MELRHLKYFIAVAEELHFGRAAQKLCIAQPPLSRQIKLLEEEIGVILLERTKRRVVLTTAGEIFLADAKVSVAQAEGAIRNAQRAARGEIGKLAIGFVHSAGYNKIPSLFCLMHNRYPEVSLFLDEMTIEEQEDALRTYRIDVGIVRPPLISTEGLSMQVISTEPLVVVLPETSHLAGEAEISIKSLAQEAFILVSRHAAPGYYDQFINLCTNTGFTPKVVQEAKTSPAIINLVASGIGISILPSSLENLQRTGVVYRPLKNPAPTSDLAIVWHTHNKSPTLWSFLKIVWEVTGIEYPGK